MPELTVPPRHSTQLRRHAEGRLEGGTAPPTNGWPTGAEALVLLHKLASNPQSASDALKLLHELQVHQVELDLQHEQLDQTRRELTEELDRLAELYDHAPLGFFTVDADGKIREANLTGAHLLGTERDDLIGRRLDSFLAPESRPVVLDLLKRRLHTGATETCGAQSFSGDGAARLWQLVAKASPGGRTVFVALTDKTEQQRAGDGPPPAPGRP